MNDNSIFGNIGGVQLLAIFLLGAFGLGNVGWLIFSIINDVGFFSQGQWIRFGLQEITVSYLSIYLAINLYKGFRFFETNNKLIVFAWLTIGLIMAWALHQSNSEWVIPLFLMGAVRSFSAACEACFENKVLSLCDAGILLIPKWAKGIRPWIRSYFSCS